MRRLFAIAALVALSSPASAGQLVEPHMHIAKGGASAPQVALTLDACDGGVDLRILNALVDNGIPATIFVTGKWIAGNASAVAVLNAHPELFEIEDHGAQHIAAVLGTQHPYGVAPAGTADGLFAEVIGGAQAVETAFAVRPVWYRDATALYSPDAMSLIESMGLSIAGFSLNGDYGASSPAKSVAARIGNAADGDVIIAHINQPKRESGAGVVEGILALKAKGYRFLRLSDTTVIPG